MAQLTDTNIGKLFLMFKRRCLPAISYDELGNIEVDLHRVDDETVRRALIQIGLW
jgi:hypothetical protein